MSEVKLYHPEDDRYYTVSSERWQVMQNNGVAKLYQVIIEGDKSQPDTQPDANEDQEQTDGAQMTKAPKFKRKKA